jgi:group II intron reverse transcriptase/maturase
MEGKMTDTSGSTNVSTKLHRIAELARKAPEMVLTTLAHHMDVDFLREAYRRTRKDGAAGVDGQTAKQYEKDLEANLQSLLERFKSGAYKAPPVRRVYIPKGDGSKTRPIGIPTFEDKVLQRAVAMVLEAVYEEDFYNFSYGFRPKRSAHHALAYLWKELMDMGGGWVLDLDIKSFFDTMDHSHLRAFLDQRVRDGVLRRAIDKWLKAGILEDGQFRRSENGTPQGGVVSPILSNVYLHEVLDKWFECQVKPRLQGKAFVVRFADDAVIVFASEADARRVLEVLPKRFEKYGLTLHPEKTCLVAFRRPVRSSQGKDSNDEQQRPGHFDILGFTHFWARSRRGNWVIKRRTSSSRFARAVRRVYEWCRKHRHWKVKEQHAALKRKLQGHYAYYGITGNSYALSRFTYEVMRAWRKWLNRRSQRRTMPWEKFNALLKRLPLPPVRCVHSVLCHAANP